MKAKISTNIPLKKQISVLTIQFYKLTDMYTPDKNAKEILIFSNNFTFEHQRGIDRLSLAEDFDNANMVEMMKLHLRIIFIANIINFPLSSIVPTLSIIAENNLNTWNISIGN